MAGFILAVIGYYILGNADVLSQNGLDAGLSARYLALFGLSWELKTGMYQKL